MPSKVEIANMALGHLGIGKTISNLETERSENALRAKLFYAPALEATLKAYDWPFATKTAFLALISTDESADAIWKYTYRYPTDCIKHRHIVPAKDVYTVPGIVRIPCQIGDDETGLTIMTNEKTARSEYTKRSENPVLYSYLFANTVSFLLAFYMAPGLTKGDPNKLGDAAFAQFNTHLNIAQGQEFHEEDQVPIDQDTISEYTRARN